MAAVHDQGVMGLDEDEPFGCVSDLPVNGVAGGRALVAMGGIVRFKAQEMGIALLVELPGRKPGHLVDVLLVGLPVTCLDEVMQESAGPSVARLWIGRDPDDSRFLRHA